MSKIQAIRGMNDLLPEQTPVWQYVERIAEQVVQSYGYREIRFPILEQSQLFKRSIGEVTDIVEKEMYSFADRNGEDLSLRPEGTAGCVRAADQHGLLYNQQQRLWYRGPMFRYERPQKGRYRQFHQMGVESFGMTGPDIDAEMILLSAALWRELGLSGSVRLEINNIGSSEDRKRYGAALVAYLEQHVDQLDEDSQRRLSANPLRILDSKSPQTQAVLVDAPILGDYLNEESQAHYLALKTLLDEAGLSYVENPRLVRGLDYYNNMVFEWITDDLGAQGTVCAGGRYDGLVAQLGGKPTPAVGLAFGLERLVLLVESAGNVPDSALKPVDVYLLASDKSLQASVLTLAEALRAELPGLRLLAHCGGGKFNSQLKKAFASGATLALIVDPADEPGQSEKLRLRPLADEAEVETVTRSDLSTRLQTLLAQS